MLWLIDGYNVIRGVEDLRAAEAGGLRRGREALVGLLALFARGGARGARVVVVFDGPAGGFPFSSRAPAGVSVVFSGGRSADQVIREKVSVEKDPGRVTVVSVDREVSGHARRSGCRVETPVSFFGRLAGDPKIRRPEGSVPDRRRIERELRRHLEI